RERRLALADEPSLPASTVDPGGIIPASQVWNEEAAGKAARLARWVLEEGCDVRPRLVDLGWRDEQDTGPRQAHEAVRRCDPRTKLGHPARNRQCGFATVATA